MTLPDIDCRRILEGGRSGEVERHAFDVEKVTPSSRTTLTVSGLGGWGGGVVGVEVVGVVDFDRDLNENFCFGTNFTFADDIRSASCLSC